MRYLGLITPPVRTFEAHADWIAHLREVAGEVGRGPESVRVGD